MSAGCTDKIFHESEPLFHLQKKYGLLTQIFQESEPLCHPDLIFMIHWPAWLRRRKNRKRRRRQEKHLLVSQKKEIWQREWHVHRSERITQSDFAPLSLSLSLSLFLSFPEARSRPSVGKLFIRHSVLQMAKTEVWYPLIWGTVTLILCWRYAFFFQYCTSFWSGLSVRRLARPSPELPTIPRYSPLRCQTGRLDSY